MIRYIWEKSNWTDFHWHNRSLLGPLGVARRCQGDLLSRAKALGVGLGNEARSEVLVEEAVQTAAIEGEIYNRDTVRSSVARRLGLPNAGLPQSERHVDGLVDVLLDATAGYDQPLTASRLQSWQASLFPTGYSGLHPVRTGQWRGKAPMRVVSGPIGRETIHFEAPPVDSIGDEIMGFLSWWEHSRMKQEGLLRAALAHFHFITIHPFEDGNGRIARAVTDMALAQDEALPDRFYSLSSQIGTERSDYYAVLERCQKGHGDITEWLVWFLGCFERAVNASSRLISGILVKAIFWREHSQTPMTDRQRKVVNRLLDTGQGAFQGGLTTKKYVGMTRTSRATAYREISDLVTKKVLLQNPGKGRNVSYDLVWPDID